MSRARLSSFHDLVPGQPRAARAAGFDLVVIRVGDDVRVLSGRCPHRGAPMCEGSVVGDDLVCRRHGWSFRVETGESAHIEGERLGRFTATVDREADAVSVDEDELRSWARENPQAFNPDEDLI